MKRSSEARRGGTFWGTDGGGANSLREGERVCAR